MNRCRKAIMPSLALAALALLMPLLHPHTQAQDASETPTYFIYPVSTELQQELTPPKTKVFALVDTSAALQDGHATFKGLEITRLRKDFQKHIKGGSVLHCMLFFGKSDEARREAEEVLRYALIGIGHEAGFDKVSASGYWVNLETAWEQLVDPLVRKQVGQPAGKESGKGNEGIKAYPVQSELSRFLAGGADCVLVIRPPLEKVNGTIPDAIKEAAEKAVGELELQNKKKMVVYVKYVSDGQRKPLLKALDGLVRGLGFEESSVTFR